MSAAWHRVITRGRRPSSIVALGRDRLDAEVLIDAAMHARHALDLPLGREALVETLGAEVWLELAQAAELVVPAALAIVGIAVEALQIGADTHQGLERDGARHHVAVVAPRSLKHLRRDAQEVAQRLVELGARNFLDVA